MEAGIQLPLRRFPDSSVSFLIRNWLMPGRTSGHQKLALLTITSLWPSVIVAIRYCGLVAWFRTGCEFDSWQCRIYIPCSLSLRLLGSLRGSLGTYGLTQKLCFLKKNLKKDRQVRHGDWSHQRLVVYPRVNVRP